MSAAARRRGCVHAKCILLNSTCHVGSRCGRLRRGTEVDASRAREACESSRVLEASLFVSGSDLCLGSVGHQADEDTGFFFLANQICSSTPPFYALKLLPPHGIPNGIPGAFGVRSQPCPLA